MSQSKQKKGFCPYPFRAVTPSIQNDISQFDVVAYDNDNKENNNTNKGNNSKKKNKINNINEENKTIEKDKININKVNANVIISRAQYLYIIGPCYYIFHNFSLSSPLLQESIKLDPLLIECWNTLGDIYYNNSELFAPKFCFESALEYDKYNKISYISLSKILRKLHSKNQMEIMENCICSLILAKQALKYSKKNKNSSLSLKDGELWFNLGNAYLMTFLNCINGWKLESSIKLQKEDNNDIKNNSESITNDNNKKQSKKQNNKQSKDEDKDNNNNKIDIGIDETYFEKEYEYEQIYSEIRREIETELNDSQNNLLHHIYIKKCLSAYKCASTKCIINKHSHHPDLYCNRSHIYIYQENYEQSLQDLKLSIKYGRNDSVSHSGGNGEQSAKIIHDELLTKLCKISKQISNKTSNKMIKKLTNFSDQISRYMKQCSDYYTRQLHYDLVTFDKLNNGLNGGNVIVIKIFGLMQPSNQLPLHFIVCDNNQNMFVLSFYLRGHALNHIYKIVNQINIINTQTLICVANPVKRHIKFNHGSKHIDFYTISFQKPQDICIGGKFFFNQ